MDEIQTKALRVFLLAIHSHLYPVQCTLCVQLCHEIFISLNSRKLLHSSSNSCKLLRNSTLKLLYTVKEKGGKPDTKRSIPLPYGLRNPYRNLKSENSQDYAPETSKKLYVHEFAFRTGCGLDHAFDDCIFCQVSGTQSPFSLKIYKFISSFRDIKY